MRVPRLHGRVAGVLKGAAAAAKGASLRLSKLIYSNDMRAVRLLARPSTTTGYSAYLMCLNMSSAPSDPSLRSVPNFLSSGSLGGGGPFFVEFSSSIALPFWNSLASERLPMPNIVLARLLNQLPLFLRSRAPGRAFGPAFVDVELCGLVGRPLRRLSDEEAERKPRKRRMDEGRLPPEVLSVVGVGLKGFLEPGEPGLVLAVATLSVRPRALALPLVEELSFA